MFSMANSIMIDLEDPMTEKIADVISNKTAKRILGLLAESELSESDLANSLGLPLNTVEYNIKKLEDVGLIEKVKGFLWSVKGKRIHRYKISNKKIVISPKRIIKGIVPAVLISGAIAFGIKIWIDNKIVVSGGEGAAEKVIEKSLAAVTDNSRAITSYGNVNVGIIAQNAWLWFFSGALVGLLIFLVWNLFRSSK